MRIDKEMKSHSGCMFFFVALHFFLEIQSCGLSKKKRKHFFTKECSQQVIHTFSSFSFYGLFLFETVQKTTVAENEIATFSP